MAALAEIWTLTIVSVDRAQAIFHPIDTKKRMSSAQVSTYKTTILVHNLDSNVCPFFMLSSNKIERTFFSLGSSVDRNHLDHCIGFRCVPTPWMERVQL